MIKTPRHRAKDAMQHGIHIRIHNQKHSTVQYQCNSFGSLPISPQTFMYFTQHLSDGNSLRVSTLQEHPSNIV